MSIRRQSIDMDSATYTRTVFDDSVDETADIETGWIEIQNKFLPVWRPYKQTKMANSEGVWRPVYRILTETGARRRSYQRGKVQVDGQELDLPLAKLEVTSKLRLHLKGYRPAR